VLSEPANDDLAQPLIRIFGFPDWSDFESLIQEIDEDSEFPTPGRFPLNVPQLVGVGQ